MRNNRASIGWTARLVLALVVLSAAGLIIRSCRAKVAGSKETFRRAQVIRQDLSLTKTATGEVRPQNRVEVKPPIAGRIEQILVREGETVAQGQVLAWMSSADRAALLDAARAQGPEMVERWESAYKPAPLIAPLEGTLIVRAVEPGQTVATSDPVVVIADRLIVKAQVDETDIGSIRVGQSATISLDAYPDEKTPARVDHIAYEAKTVNNVTIYEVDVLPDAVPEVMRSGMTAMVNFTIEARSGALTIPSEAVRPHPSGAGVLTPGAGAWEAPKRRAVTLGMSDGRSVEVLSGLQEGETVLVPSLPPPRGGRPQGRSPFSPFGSARGGRADNQRR